MITETEKMILKLLVKKHSKNNLQIVFDQYVDSKGNDAPEIVERLLSSMGLSNYHRLSIQYLNYGLNFYDNIKSNDFSNEMERLVNYNISIGAKETEIVYVDYTSTITSLPSLVDVIALDFFENPWDYDADREIIDYGDTINTKWGDEYKLSSPYKPFSETIIN